LLAHLYKEEVAVLSITIRSRHIKWTAGATALLGLGALALHAFTPQPDPPKVFAVFGITPSDNLRVNVANVGSSVGAPPDPCRAALSFVDADGNVLKSNTVSIADGHTAAFAISFAEASSPTATAVARTRVSIRPAINFAPPDPCFTAVSAEVTDAIAGRTNIYATPQLWAAAPAASVNPAQ